MLFSFSSVSAYRVVIVSLAIVGYQLLPSQPLLAEPAKVITDNFASDFEDMMRSFPECKFEGVYLAPWEGIDRPKHRFFQRLVPDKIEDDFAYYQIKESYYGLPVSAVMIPAGTWGVYAVTFEVPVEIAREPLQAVFGSNFEETRESNLGLAPQLIMDPVNEQKSIWVCTSPL
ncbi:MULTISPECIES: hypothetical protein [unclassified Synechocystis]|uniref:hypothetical protein n=1 Tax=unclassified Synechocystis TaxID=2640012 RepID=UPI0002A58E98|nr:MULTISPECIES: hypothetical protein [unclassified Synechocystis]UOO12778.1 hypothetical protein MT986_05785 [Synechocystis sp. PCC 6803]BAM51434.1 hypothetical protein BEST7613_2503 [Synechocystis sp. PCC 6803] [Bacillus subtilis BEST7613]